MRKTLRVVSVLGLTLGLVFAMSPPASATIHEIVASFCASTHDVPSPTGHIHDPPGLTPEELGGTSAADNVAQPLLASGAFEARTGDEDETILVLAVDEDGDPIFDEDGEPVFHPVDVEGETLLEVNEDRPNVKFIGSGLFFFDPSEGVYVEIGLPDEDFAAFANCANLAEAH